MTRSKTKIPQIIALTGLRQACRKNCLILSTILLRGTDSRICDSTTSDTVIPEIVLYTFFNCRLERRNNAIALIPIIQP